MNNVIEIPVSNPVRVTPPPAGALASPQSSCRIARRTLVKCLGAALALSAMPLASMAVADDAAADMKVRAEPMISEANNAFSADLYARLSKSSGNLFFSPYSIHSALGMTWAGARGKTAQQMADVLHLKGAVAAVNAEFAQVIKLVNASGKLGEGTAFDLVTANALWGQKGFTFNPDYKDSVEKSYAAPLNQLDYANDAEGSRKTINQWVEKQTHDRIKDLIPSGAITPTTRLVLTNAIYFKSNWDEKFTKDQTAEADFKVSGDKTAKASFMHQVNSFNYADDGKVQVLEMPYTMRRLSMVVLLPKDADALAAIEKTLTADSLAKLSASMKHRRVDVSFPKFKIEAQFELADVLKALGMSDAFSSDADFSGMTTEEKLQISAVIHKAFVAVDEDGTEAAAATAVVMRAMSARIDPEAPIPFKADHPFIFAIRHNQTGEILFIGRVVNPNG